MCVWLLIFTDPVADAEIQQEREALQASGDLPAEDPIEEVSVLLHGFSIPSRFQRAVATPNSTMKACLRRRKYLILLPTGRRMTPWKMEVSGNASHDHP